MHLTYRAIVAKENFVEQIKLFVTEYFSDIGILLLGV